jgi:peroxiredoxin (alkyl hydroperoxide reductase subunit C)
VPPIEAGRPAPEFSLGTSGGGRFTRADLEGRITVLVFYPFAFSPVCTDQLSVYEEVLEDLGDRGATMYGVSCDAVWSQQALRERHGLTIEQLSDFEPKGAACRAFGVLNPGGFAERALVMTGPDGVVRWSHQADAPAEVPGANLIFDALDAAAARAAEAAALQGAFWPFHDALFADQGRLDDPHLWARAERLGLDVARFDADRRSDPVAARVRADFRGGIRAGVATTPTLFVDGVRHGGRPSPELWAALGAS